MNLVLVDDLSKMLDTVGEFAGDKVNGEGEGQKGKEGEDVRPKTEANGCK